VDQASVVAALLEELLDPVLLAKSSQLANEFDLEPFAARNRFRVAANDVAQRFSPLRVVENPNTNTSNSDVIPAA